MFDTETSTKALIFSHLISLTSNSHICLACMYSRYCSSFEIISYFPILDKKGAHCTGWPKENVQNVNKLERNSSYMLSDATIQSCYLLTTLLPTAIRINVRNGSCWKKPVGARFFKQVGREEEEYNVIKAGTLVRGDTQPKE